ncbi:MAG: ATP phosphoribosyltransferase regulatory subunit [Thermosynechococcaceae cyanobacterium]
MIHQTPSGARDLLPLDVAQKRWIEHQLQDTFHRWSYHRIITPTLERLDTLQAGGAVQSETVLQVWDAEEGFLGLRPELTASIARAAVTRMAGATYPQRLYYIANIFRRQLGEQTRGQHEFYQAGIELLGAGGALADAEVLGLLADGLAQVGLASWHLVLGDAGLTRSLLWDFPKPLRGKVREAIAQLDRVALDTLPLDGDLRSRALRLMDLRGEPSEVLQQVSQWTLDDTQRAAVQHLKSVVDLLDGHPSVILDLSFIQTFDYYTGLIFVVVGSTQGSQRVLGQGGRYDQLLGLYHPEGQMIPGMGFSLNVQDLQQVLLPTGVLPDSIPVSDWLVVADGPQSVAAAFRHAQTLRSQSVPSVRVEVELEMRSPDATRAYAQSRSIEQIAWVNGAGSVTIETVSPS